MAEEIYRDYLIDTLGQLSMLRDMHTRKGEGSEPARVNAILKVLTAHSRATGAGDAESAHGLKLRMRIYGEGRAETMWIVRMRGKGADRLLKLNRNTVREHIRAGALELREADDG